MERRYFWTKVWGAPDVPAHDALAFSHEGTRDDVLAEILAGDIVVFGVTTRFAQNSTLTGCSTCRLRFGTILKGIMNETSPEGA